MKKFIVTFRAEGSIHSLEFMDNINNDKAREVNAKMWINDYIQDQLGIKTGVVYQIISIQQISD